jgi:hypothetical protein
LVSKLNKAIYGLKQDPRARFKCLNKALRSFDFQPCKCDPSLFTLITPRFTILMLVYVDDIIGHWQLSFSYNWVHYKIKCRIFSQITGQLGIFSGYWSKLAQNWRLLLYQTKYIKGLHMPMVSNLKLSEHGSKYLEDATTNQ